MANTTNFGWETPDDTDLVKDGAAAIRTLGSAIDTSLVDLKGGTTGQILSKATNTDMDFTWITNDVGDITEVVAGTGLSGGGSSGSVTLTNTVATEFDAKGDLVVGTGADTFDKLTAGTNEHRLVADSGETTGLKYVADTTNYAIAAKGNLLVGTAADTLSALTVGTNGHVLTADSTEATGVKWAAPAAGGGYTSLATGSFSGTSTSVNITTTGYKELRIFAKDVAVASADWNIDLRFNSDTGNNYSFVSQYSSGTTTATQEARSASDAFFVDALDAGDLSYYVFTIYDPAITDGHKIFSGWFMGRDSADTYNSAGICNGRYMSDSAITNVTFYTGGTAVTSGTYEIYGVK